MPFQLCGDDKVNISYTAPSSPLVKKPPSYIHFTVPVEGICSRLFRTKVKALYLPTAWCVVDTAVYIPIQIVLQCQLSLNTPFTYYIIYEKLMEVLTFKMFT